MSSSKPIIDSWHAYRISPTLAELVIMGSGFGPTKGSVKLNIQGGGVVTVAVKTWFDTAIVVNAPVDSVIKRAHVYALDDRGKNKQSAQSPAGEDRNTSGAAPAWAVTSTDDNVDHIVVEGTLLEQVVDVVLYDGAAAPRLYEASHLLEDGDLKIDWPAAFTSPISKLRLSDANGDHVSEVSGGVSGLTPDPNGVIMSVSLNGPILTIIGSGFGSQEGSVSLALVGGQLTPADVISNGWSDTVVQVAVQPGSSYDAIELTRFDGEVSTVDGGVIFPVRHLTSVSFENGQITAVGEGFDNNVGLVIDLDSPFLPFIAIDYSFEPGYESRSDTQVVTISLGDLLDQLGAEPNGTYDITRVWLRSVLDNADLGSVDDSAITGDDTHLYGNGLTVNI